MRGIDLPIHSYPHTMRSASRRALLPPAAHTDTSETRPPVTSESLSSATLVFNVGAIGAMTSLKQGGVSATISINNLAPSVARRMSWWRPMAACHVNASRTPRRMSPGDSVVTVTAVREPQQARQNAERPPWSPIGAATHRVTRRWTAAGPHRCPVRTAYTFVLLRQLHQLMHMAWCLYAYGPVKGWNSGEHTRG